MSTSEKATTAEIEVELEEALWAEYNPKEIKNSKDLVELFKKFQLQAEFQAHVPAIEPPDPDVCLPEDAFEFNGLGTLLTSQQAETLSFPFNDAHEVLDGKPLRNATLEFPKAPVFHICSSRVKDPQRGSFHAAFFCKLHHSKSCPCKAPPIKLAAVLKLRIYPNMNCYRMSARHTLATFRKYHLLKKVIEVNQIPGVRVVQFTIVTGKDGDHYWLEEMLPGEFCKFTAKGMTSAGRLVTTKNSILRKLQIACSRTKALNGEFPIDLQGVMHEGNIILTDIEWTSWVSTLDPMMLSHDCKKQLQRNASYWAEAKDVPPLLEVEYDDYAPKAEEPETDDE